MLFYDGHVDAPYRGYLMASIQGDSRIGMHIISIQPSGILNDEPRMNLFKNKKSYQCISSIERGRHVQYL